MQWFERYAMRRAADVLIGGSAAPYMKRWFIIPRNRWFNIYLHHFLRSDDDRALHDHPSFNLSILLKGSYTEWTIAAGGVHHAVIRSAGQFKFRTASSAHRIELHDGPCWTLWIKGPTYRTWGFHCPQGWRRWQDFTGDYGSKDKGKGCD